VVTSAAVVAGPEVAAGTLGIYVVKKTAEAVVNKLF